MKAYHSAILAMGIFSIAATAAPAFAWGSHPRRLEVNGRLYNQNHRITQGVRDGQLTHQQAHQLRSNDRAIYGEEHQMAKLDGGHITRADQRSLNQQENANSQAIYTDRHD